MPAATDCIFNNKLITVNEAVKERTLAEKNKKLPPFFYVKNAEKRLQP